MSCGLVVGATGATGKLVLEKLLLNKEFDKVYTISRRELGIKHSKLSSFIIDFEKMDEFNFPEGTKIDQLYFCYGTTLKKAGGKTAFRKIEGDYSQKILNLAKRAQVKRVLLVSSIGADANSSFLYTKTKGMIEKYAANLGFSEIVIFRPSLLLTEREELRVAELISQKVMKPFSNVLQTIFPKYAPISTEMLSDRLIAWGKRDVLDRPICILENMALIQES
jgi:uncharacterized protein YbjT (DUF2867 family)